MEDGDETMTKGGDDRPTHSIGSARAVSMHGEQRAGLYHSQAGRLTRRRASSGQAVKYRRALAMCATPVLRSRPMTRLHRVAMTRGRRPRRVWARASSKSTSRQTQQRWERVPSPPGLTRIGYLLQLSIQRRYLLLALTRHSGGSPLLWFPPLSHHLPLWARMIKPWYSVGLYRSRVVYYRLGDQP